MWLKLAWQSLLNRKVSALLTLVALTVSVSLLFAIEHIRIQAQDNFKRTVSGVDLVVAARSSQINVLLSSVFRLGANPNPLSWQTFETIQGNPQVVWAVPLSLGDTYKGFPVVGTTPSYFEHYKYADKRGLELAQGRIFASPTEVVVGASVAKSEGLQIGSAIVVSHGSGKVSFTHHNHHPLIVSGILSPTGTPVDKSLHVPLIAIDEMHKPAAPVSAFARPKAEVVKDDDDDHDEDSHSHDEHSHDQQVLQVLPEIPDGTYDLIGSPTNISALLLKTDSPFSILTLQRDLNRYQDEAISAIIPGLALAQLWKTIGSVETILQVIAMLVLVSSLIGLVTMLLASMHERRAEISVLRAIGASPWFIASLIQAEAFVIAILALLSSYALVSGGIWLFADWILAEYGVFIAANIYSNGILIYSALVMGLTLMVAALPAINAYRSAKQLFR
jgi:putative ABC transport system permease protein